MVIDCDWIWVAFGARVRDTSQYGVSGDPVHSGLSMGKVLDVFTTVGGWNCMGRDGGMEEGMDKRNCECPHRSQRVSPRPG